MGHAKLILMVCRGNISRSPVAAIILQRKLAEHGLDGGYSVASRGTQGVAPDDLEPVKFPNITYYGDFYENSKSWLHEHSIDLSSHTSRPIDHDIVRKASVIFAMDRKTIQALAMLFPEEVHKTHLLAEIIAEHEEVIDPEEVPERVKVEQILSSMESMITTGLPTLLAIADGKTQRH
jgi:protein-tyrosine-phosphatase